MCQIYCKIPDCCAVKLAYSASPFKFPQQTDLENERM